jgi:hypothetical protein
MFVACNLPAGLIVRHNGQEIRLNGGNTGLDAQNLPRNGSAPDDANRVSGYGLTEVSGDQAEALKDWMALSAKGHGPVRSGALIIAGSKADVAKEAKANEGAAAGFSGLDPAKDLPAGVETADDTKTG